MRQNDKILVLALTKWMVSLVDVEFSWGITILVYSTCSVLSKTKCWLSSHVNLLIKMSANWWSIFILIGDSVHALASLSDFLSEAAKMVLFHFSHFRFLQQPMLLKHALSLLFLVVGHSLRLKLFWVFWLLAIKPGIFLELRIM